jgi:hypothetical protein
MATSRSFHRNQRLHMRRWAAIAAAALMISTLFALFGARVASAVGDLTIRVYMDSDRNGQYDSGEPAVSGVPVSVYNTDNNLLFSVNTNASGLAIFPNTPNGDYRVEVTNPGNGAPNGTVISLPGSTTPGQDNALVFFVTINNAPVQRDVGLRSLDASGIDTSAPAGYRTIVVRAWDDLDANGIQDAGEPGINGLTLGLYNPSSGLVATATTGPDGTYRFVDSVPANVSNYTIRVTGGVTPGLVLTTPNANLDSEDRRDSDAQLVAGEPRITVPNQARGVNDDSLDVGFSRGAVSGFVWRDLDQDGLRDPGEPFINGVTVELLSGSTPIMTETTRSILNDPFNRAGFFEFTSVPLTATYRVRIPNAEFNNPTDLLFGHATPQTQTVSLPQIGNQGLVDGSTPGPAVVGPTNYLATAQFTLDATNRRNETSNFGLYAGTVGDFVWHDVNRNGIVDPLETTLGLANALVFIDLNSNCLIDTGELTTTTNTSGYYLFDSLPLGYTYTVVLDASNFAPGGALEGLGYTTGAACGSNEGVFITMTTALTATDPSFLNADFGIARAEIGNFVWEDDNGNGIFDPSETGVPSVTVQLYGAGPDGIFFTADDVTVGVSQTTNASGIYTITDIISGTYYATFDLSLLQSAYVASVYTPTGWPGVDPRAIDSDDVNDVREFVGERVWRTPTFTITRGSRNIGVDAAVFRPVTVVARVFDENPPVDNAYQTGDTGITTATVTITTTNGTVTPLSVVSDTTGLITFTLVPTTTPYWVNVAAPPGFTPSPGNSGAVQITPDPISGDTVGPTGLEFGYFRAVTVVARVFDENPPVDNVYQAGDTGITTATVTITTTNGTVTPLSVVSDTTGLITFTLVPTSNTTPYWVNVATPTGFTPSPGNTGALEVAPNPGPGDSAGVFEFGYFRAVTVVARVFEENPPVNNVYQAGDTGITTATVTITTTNGTVTPLNATPIDATGLITFTLVPTDSATPYWVNVATPPGFAPSPGNGGALEVTPNPGPGDSAGVFQFGYFRAVTVVARVFEENPPVDNVYQAGDTGITTATVTITTTNGTVTPLNATPIDATGLITFTLVPTDSATPYWVNVATPTGFAPSPGNGGALEVTPNPGPGGSAGVFEFGYFRAVTVVARVFEENPPVDNVYQAGDTGITTATVTITTTNGTVTPLNATPIDATGLITFTLVPTDSATPYWVNVATPTGFAPSPGNGGALEVTPNPGPGGSAGVFEFGYFRAVTVVARVFEENPPVDNVYQAGDTGITTATVTITTTNGTVTPLNATPIDATGLITFTLVPTDSATPYWVNVATPPGFAPSPGNGGALEVTPNPGPGGSAGVFQFGYFRAVTVVARVFEENPPVNNVYQAGDTGITTATVTITTTNGTVTPLNATPIDATGLITFTLVPTDSATPYWVNVATPTGFAPSPGNGGALEVTPNPGPGGSAGVFQFGYFRAVTVVARVFEENPPVDNVYQAGDTGITTATVTITTTNGTVTPLNATPIDATGLITFTLVPTDSATPYWVNVATPTGFAPSPGNGGALEVTPNPGPGGSAGVFEFGYFRAVTVVARVFEENPPVDNVYQAGDTGITTATVTITTTNGTVTPLNATPIDATGLITFTLVPTDSATPYWVNVATPPGFAPSSGNGGALEVTPNPGPGGSAGVFEFGYFRAVTVVARVFEENPPVDNVYQAGDTGITTATVTITTTNGTVTPLNATPIDATGLITFTLVPTDSATPYWVNVATPTGFAPSPGNGGALEVTPNPGPGDSAGVFEFGYFRAVTVVARVFEENPPVDNVYQAGDTGITTATVTITTTNGTVTPLNATPIDATGLITFTLVPTSNTTPYWVNVATPPGFARLRAVAGERRRAGGDAQSGTGRQRGGVRVRLLPGGDRRGARV